MKRVNFTILTLILLTCTLFLTACKQQNKDKEMHEQEEQTGSIFSGILDSDDTDKEDKQLSKASEFKYTDLSGAEVTLKGVLKDKKYVVLDFWGSWCQWCIKGIPQMKKYYGKYSSKVEFIGVACYDEEATIRKLVRVEDMPWRHILNDEDSEGNDLTQLYDIQGFPTKIIINANGYIVARYEGESEDFYKKLDELMN